MKQPGIQGDQVENNDFFLRNSSAAQVGTCCKTSAFKGLISAA